MIFASVQLRRPYDCRPDDVMPALKCACLSSGARPSLSIAMPRASFTYRQRRGHTTARTPRAISKPLTMPRFTFLPAYVPGRRVSSRRADYANYRRRLDFCDDRRHASACLTSRRRRDGHLSPTTPFSRYDFCSRHYISMIPKRFRDAADFIGDAQDGPAAHAELVNISALASARARLPFRRVSADS